MNAEDKKWKDLERLNALLDGESSDPERDLAWAQSDPARALRLRQYQQLRALTKMLDEPGLAPELADRVLTQVQGPRPGFPWHYAYAVAAGLLLMIGGVVLYLTYPYSPMDTPPNVVILEEDTLPPDGETPLDPQLLLYGAAAEESPGMTGPLDSLEELSEEELVCALAALANAEETGFWSGGADVITPLEEESGENEGDATSFVELLDFVDTLDAVEADALNQALRAALEEA